MNWIRLGFFLLVLIFSTVLGFSRHHDAQAPVFPLTEDEELAVALGHAFSSPDSEATRDSTYDYLSFGPPVSIQLATSEADRDTAFGAELIVDPEGFQTDTPAALLMIHTANPVQLFISADRPDRDGTLVELPGDSLSYGGYFPHRGSTSMIDDRMVVLIFDLPATTIRQEKGTVVTNLPAFESYEWDLNLPTIKTVMPPELNGNYAICPVYVAPDEADMSPYCTDPSVPQTAFYSPRQLKTVVRAETLGSLAKHSRVDVSTPVGAEIDGNDYVWHGSNDLRPFLAATDFGEIDNRAEAQFQSGLAFGVAGTAAIAMVQEMRRSSKGVPKGKGAISAQADATEASTSEFDAKGERAGGGNFAFTDSLVLIGLSVLIFLGSSRRRRRP